MDLESIKDGLSDNLQILNAFLDDLASRVSLKALVVGLGSGLLITSLLLGMILSSRPSRVERALTQARILSASGKYTEAIEVLSAVKDKKMAPDLKKELISQLVKNQRFLNSPPGGVVAGEKTNFGFPD